MLPASSSPRRRRDPSATSTTPPAQAKIHSPQTYDCPLLASWLPPGALKDIVERLLSLAGKQGKNCGKHIGFVADPVDLDLFYETLLDVLLDAIDVQQGMLVRTFDKFQVMDADMGLSFDEYPDRAEIVPAGPGFAMSRG